MKHFLSFAVVASVILTPATLRSATRSWVNTGQADKNWNTASNWSGGLVPKDGDDLLFSSAGTPAATVNNLPALPILRSVRFIAPGYQLGGGGMALTNGLTLVHAPGVSLLNFAVRLDGNQTWIVGDPTLQSATLIIGNILQLNGSDLTVINRGVVNFNSVFQGATLSTVTLQGPGRRTAATNRTWQANLTLTDGEIEFDSTQTAGEVAVTGGAFGGNGSVQKVTVTGQGLLYPRVVGGPAAPLKVVGDLRLAASASLRLDVLGSAFDQLQVGGKVTLEGALQVALSDGFQPPAGGTKFTLIDNQGSQPVEGEFSNLPEASTFRAQNRVFRITYRGGDGNDVVLETLTGEVRVFTAGALVNRDKWSKDNNWSPESAPSTGMNLAFPELVAATIAIASDNDISGRTFGMLRMESADYSLTGAALTLRHGIEVFERGGINLTNKSVAFTQIKLAENQPFVAHKDINFTVNSTVDLAGKNLTLIGAGNILMAKEISGAGGLVKAGPGKAKLAARNSFSGDVQIRQGALEIDDLGSLGAGGETVVASGAKLTVSAPPSSNPLSEKLTLAGTLEFSPTNATIRTLVGQITLQPGARVSPRQNDLRVNGPLTGAGGLTLSGQGIVTLGGTAPNSFQGETVVEDSRLLLLKTNGALAAPGNVRLLDRGLLTTGLSEQIANNAIVTIDGGELDIGAVTETIGGLNVISGGVSGGSGLLKLNGNLSSVFGRISSPVRLENSTGGPDREWNIGGNPGKLTVTGAVSSNGNVALRKTGDGALVLEGDNAIPTLLAAAGNLVVKGVSSATTLRLEGGLATAKGVLSAVEGGPSGGKLTPGDETSTTSAGLVTLSRLALAANSTIVMDLNGASRGTQFDAINVTGQPPVLGNARLAVNLGFTPAVGVAMTIIDNQTPQAISGTFLNLPEGGQIFTGGLRFAISYQGGGGNDVTLMRLSSVAPALTSSQLTVAPTAGGQSQLTITGKANPNETFILQASSDLKAWTTVETVTADAAGKLDIKVAPTNLASRQRFFRVRVPGQ